MTLLKWGREMTEKPIIATELLKGQGLGNQLFCYITTRCLAYEKGWDFSILNKSLFDCLYFLNLDCGIEAKSQILIRFIMKEKTESI